MSLLPEYFSEQRSFHEARSPPQVPYNPGRRRQPSKGEWEELKPLIQHLYLEENHSLQCVTRILSEKHGFRPTHVIPLSHVKDNADSLTGRSN